MRIVVPSFDLFRLRETVFEILFAAKKVDEVSLNSLRRDCESRLKLSTNTLDGQLCKEPLLLMFTDFMMINEIYKKWKKKYGATYTQEHEYTVGETDFVVRVFREYLTTYDVDIADIPFQSTRRCQHPIWVKLCKLVPHLSEREAQEIVRSAMDKDNIKISGSSSSSSSSNTGNHIDNSQSSTSIQSRIMNSRQTPPFISESHIDASQDSVAVQTPRGSRSIRSKTIRKKSFKMDKPTATDLQMDLSAVPCIAMKSSFSTLKWLRCIEQRQLKREAQIVWADIDKELLLPYSYSAKRWNAVSKSMPENMAFSKKLKNLIEVFSKKDDNTSETSTSEISTNVTDKKSEEDDVTDDDSQCEIMRGVYPKNHHIDSEEEFYGHNNRIKSKTPLGDMLNSLLRKRNGIQLYEGNESDLADEINSINESYTLSQSPLPMKGIYGSRSCSMDMGGDNNENENENESNSRLTNDPFISSNKLNNSVSRVGKLTTTNSTARYLAQVMDVDEVCSISEPNVTSVYNSPIDNPELLKAEKRKRCLMRNERRIRKVDRALRREGRQCSIMAP